MELQAGIAKYIIIIPLHLDTTIMPLPCFPIKRSCQESLPNTASTPNAHQATSISSVSDGAPATNPINVEKENPGESLATPFTSGGPANATTDQKKLTMSCLH